MKTENDMLIERKRLWLASIPTIVIVALIWLSFLVDSSGAASFEVFRLGILPRNVSGLPGVIFSPFLHNSVSHLLSNTVPLLILLWSLFYFYNSIAYRSLLYMWVLSGLFTWIIGRESYHVGASGLIFSMVFFLFFSGIFRRYIPLIAVSLVVTFIYGSTVWSIFPIAEIVDAQLSWEAHFSGAVAGLIIAVLFRNQGPQKPTVEWGEEDEDVSDDEAKE